MTEATRSSETSILRRATRHIPKDGILIANPSDISAKIAHHRFAKFVT
jgi:hypothetical protein